MMNFNYRRPKKQFVPFEQMIAWGLQQNSEDPTWGKFYNYARHFFAEAVKLFNGTYTYVDTEGETQYYPDLDITEDDLLNHYFEEYGSRLAARPLEIGRLSILDGQPMDYNTAMSVVLDITYRKAQKFVLFNRYKYLTLVKTTGFIYNPIENYRMVENGENEQEFLGSEEMERTTNVALGTKGWKVSGPTTGFGQVDNVPTIDYAHTHKKVEAGNNLSTSIAGSGITGVTDATASTSTVGNTTTMTANPGTVQYGTGEAGNLPTTRNYTTTYDDKTDGRLKDYSTTQGSSSTANQITSQSNEDEPAIGEIWGGTQVDPFTDTKSFNDRSNKTTHELERYGNIGVTTSQQMIQSERELARFNVIDEFCRELNKEILLGVYGC